MTGRQAWYHYLIVLVGTSLSSASLWHLTQVKSIIGVLFFALSHCLLCSPIGYNDCSPKVEVRE